MALVEHNHIVEQVPVMRYDEEAKQYAEGDCWDCEEVHRGNCFAVVAL